MNGMVRTAVIAAGFVMTAEGASAMGIIERACMGAQKGATAVLCTCIQQVADQVLDPKDQRKGAALFEDPHKSQELRQSPDSDDESFWLRWKEYGAHAERLCS
ncbi:hypothetical protein [uncultured Maritimibacter sp.]|jgi:hypothetical protein|uniref:hypothetical protein n=1 Tax=uncultured Maritimibacter sp. TaxID=991866 RepID=UPI0026022A3D|nr:hypothetical protein [uncultured Maritimibacter sp.]